MVSFYKINKSEIQGFNFYVEKNRIRENADFMLCCFGGSVFIDFSVTGEYKIKLLRISFDTYGCCETGSKAVPLCLDDSKLFLAAVQSEKIEQTALEALVKKSIALNIHYLWKDALKAYFLYNQVNESVLSFTQKNKATELIQLIESQYTPATHSHCCSV